MAVKILTACSIEHKKYLKSCLRSTHNQNCIHYYEIDKRREGKGVLMNRLLESVNDNDIVGVLDADDMAAPNWIERIGLMKTFDLVYGDTMNIKANDDGQRYVSRDFDKELFRKINFIPYSGTLIKGWLAKSVEYPNLVHAADWLYWHRLLQHSDSFHYAPGIVSIRRTWTSHRKCNIPVYRKIRRLYRDYKVKQLINEIRT